MVSHFSRVRLCATLWTVACQAPLSMGFSRWEYQSGLPCLPPGDFPDPGIEPAFLTSPVLAGRFFTASTSWEAWEPNRSQLEKQKCVCRAPTPAPLDSVWKSGFGAATRVPHKWAAKLYRLRGERQMMFRGQDSAGLSYGSVVESLWLSFCICVLKRKWWTRMVV